MPTTLKIDVDIPELKKDKTLLELFIQTRLAIIQNVELTPNHVRWTETQKGFHFWFTIQEDLTDKEICDLQFLLGDDQTRCRFNYLRLEAGCFRQFNVLFNRKLKTHNQKKKQNLLARIFQLLSNLTHTP